MNDSSSLPLSYIINHLGEERSAYFHSTVPPIFQTSMFAFPSVEAMRYAVQHESEVPFYTRGNNPTTDILRKKIAALEGAEDCLLFASGSAAVAAAVMPHLKAGDHVVCVQKPYSWTNKLLTLLLARFDIRVTMVEGSEADNFERAIEPTTRLIYLESPNSWTFELQDIAAVAQIAKKHGLVSVIDNSYATPLYQKPIELGIDITLHSATKYLNGHSDTVAGAICGTKAMMQKIFNSEYMTLGGVISPFNSWLLMRGLRTLPIRLERAGKTTMQVVQFLATHPKIEKIFYPFHESHPQYELAQRQMSAPAGMFTIALKANDIASVERFCNALQYFLLAVSWGSYESLAFPACVLYTSENYQGAAQTLHWSWIRLYIGLEDADLLIADLDQALGLL
ncbi:MAG: aminotransferase class I/II-fold pyridoxal phosphate-dependent enzyme [Cytophagales bacterium]|nr:MAG: aminotransferase class I/II-fold pyridoxal phosphate-dependent enzyme [Cytophagales bacterium]